MSTHNICFRQEIRKILYGYPLLSVAMLSHELFHHFWVYCLQSSQSIHTQNFLKVVVYHVIIIDQFWQKNVHNYWLVD